MRPIKWRRSMNISGLFALAFVVERLFKGTWPSGYVFLFSTAFVLGTMIVEATHEICGRLDWIIEKIDKYRGDWFCSYRAPE